MNKSYLIAPHQIKMYFSCSLSLHHLDKLSKLQIMKSLTVFSVAILTLTIGCDNAPAQNNGYGNHQISQAIPVQNQNNNGNQEPSQQGGYTQTQNNGGDEIIRHTFSDSQTGKPIVSIPVPSSWKFMDDAEPGKPGVTGPNGLSITEYPLQQYIYTDNPDMYQILKSNGQQITAPPGIENLLSQQLIPQGKQMGMTLLTQYPLPQVVAREVAFYSNLSHSNAQNKTQAAGTEWTDREGNKVLAVLIYHELPGAYDINWSYNVIMLKVHQAYFEKAKNQFIYAYSNQDYNPTIISNHNSQLAAQENAENARFQANQKKINDSRQQQMENTRQTNEYISNSQKEGYEFKAHNNDVLQEQEGNALNDVNVVVSPYDGKEYQVESGAQTYWINNEGKYIQSNNPNYDPNKDADYQGTWQQAPNKVYK